MRRLWLMQLISNYSFRPRFFLYCTVVNRLIWTTDKFPYMQSHSAVAAVLRNSRKFTFSLSYIIFSGSIPEVCSRLNMISRVNYFCGVIISFSLAIITIVKNLKINGRESTKICPITTWGRQNTLKFCDTYRCYTRKSQEKADDSHPYTHVTLVFTGRGKFVLNARQKRL